MSLLSVALNEVYDISHFQFLSLKLCLDVLHGRAGIAGLRSCSSGCSDS